MTMIKITDRVWARSESIVQFWIEGTPGNSLCGAYGDGIDAVVHITIEHGRASSNHIKGCRSYEEAADFLNELVRKIGFDASSPRDPVVMKNECRCCIPSGKADPKCEYCGGEGSY